MIYISFIFNEYIGEDSLCLGYRQKSKSRALSSKPTSDSPRSHTSGREKLCTTPNTTMNLLAKELGFQIEGWLWRKTHLWHLAGKSLSCFSHDNVVP